MKILLILSLGYEITCEHFIGVWKKVLIKFLNFIAPKSHNIQFNIVAWGGGGGGGGEVNRWTDGGCAILALEFILQDFMLAISIRKTGENH